MCWNKVLLLWQEIFSSHFYTLLQKVQSWETMSKFQDISATQILRDINFDNFEGPKNCHFDHLAALNLEFSITFDIFKSEIFLKI